MTSSLTTAGFPLPTLQRSELVIPPPSSKPGAWAGAPSAVEHEGRVYLAYRLRRPIGEGRGYRNVIAVSDNGVDFQTVSYVDSERFGSESLERPALAVTPDGVWRLYVSCATPGTKHWRVDLIEAATPEGLSSAPTQTVLPGNELSAVKDPVVIWDTDRWHLWASVHPLDLPEQTDRMTTDYATSPDGISWTWHGTVLSGVAGTWDARGVRVSSLQISGDELITSYDGRASAAENWEERTGVAVGRRSDGLFGQLSQTDEPPVGSDFVPGGLRYLSIVRPSAELARIYYEYTRSDGAHELRTELLAVPN